MAREILSKRNFLDFESPDSAISRSPMTLMNNYLIFPQIRTASKKRTHLSLAKKVEVKVADFDIKEAIIVLGSLISFIQ
jgi:hypothetical protein